MATRYGRRGFSSDNLKGTLGTLVRTTLAQATVVKDAIERGAREGKARLDLALAEKRRNQRLAQLGEIVAGLIRRGQLADLEDFPEVADAMAAVDACEEEIAAAAGERSDAPAWQPVGHGRGRDRDAAESGWRPDDGDDDGTVSSKDWRPPSPSAGFGHRTSGAGPDFEDDLDQYMHPDDVPGPGDDPDSPKKRGGR